MHEEIAPLATVVVSKQLCWGDAFPFPFVQTLGESNGVEAPRQLRHVFQLPGNKLHLVVDVSILFVALG